MFGATPRQLRVFLLLLLSYAAYYVTRRNYPFVLESLVRAGHAKSAVGSFGSVFELASATAKILGGVFVDTHNPRTVLAGALAVTGVCNLLFAATDVFTLWLCLWASNGVAQVSGPWMHHACMCGCLLHTYMQVRCLRASAVSAFIWRSGSQLL